ncbi:hypothetical protein GWI33_002538 [Rhynchophorus ferrugineus]|uniref:BESS domain-containing protein n=1 Tax=Rhynchophorus ferrugineus TaxID=354439 RepID=A0A834IZP3_RHYFE|nr:hypothetical protein GWI33_002538 [Rhynchophorus ferrugineus]
MESGNEAKTLWEKLRHSLRDAIRRQQRYLKNGSAVEYIKEWKFQKQMGFLQPYMANRSREGNLREDTEAIQDSEENVNVEEDYLYTQYETVNDEAKSDGLPETLPSTLAATPASTVTQKKLRKKIKEDKITALYKDIMKRREKSGKARTEKRKSMLHELKSTQNDPLFHFFMSMYQSTKRMSSLDQHIVKNRVFKTVSTVEAKLLSSSTYAVQHQLNHIQQQPSNKQPLLHYTLPYSSSCSTSSSPSYSYSDNSLLSPVGNIHEEQENNAANSDSIFNYILSKKKFC